jgi:type III secretion protein L
MASILRSTGRAQPLVHRVEVEARERARALLAEAAETASRLGAEAADERASTLREAARAGREEGLASAAAALARVALAREQRLQALEEEVGVVALEVARLLLGSELAAAPERVLDLARRALRPVRDRREVVLRLNPADVPLVRAGQGELVAHLSRAPGLSLREDAAVARGGVVVETEAGSVDARVEAQLALLERALLEVGR